MNMVMVMNTPCKKKAEMQTQVSNFIAYAVASGVAVKCCAAPGAVVCTVAGACKSVLMFSCFGQSGVNPRPAFKTNHAALVDKVYPTEPGETAPRASNLSTLLFYANAKPIKLLKVGAYVARRVESDLARGRTGYVTVSLLIIDALIAQCQPADVSIMAEDVLHIVDTVLSSSDPDLLLQATSTFVTFNTAYRHDGAVNSEVSSTYSRLVTKFCSQCTYTGKNMTLQRKMHLSGLRALRSVCGTESFLVTTSAIQVHIPNMITVLLNTFKRERYASFSEKVAPVAGAGELTPPTRAGSVTDDLVTSSILSKDAKSALQTLLGNMSGVGIISNLSTTSNASSSGLKACLSAVWAFLDSDKGVGGWHDTELVESIVILVRDGVAPQTQYVLLGSLLERLRNALVDISKNNSIETTVGIIISVKVLLSGGTGVGIAVVEVLENLVGVLSGRINANDTEKTQKPAEGVLLDAVVDCISTLAVHIVYPMQMNDIVAFVVNRLTAAGNGDNANVVKVNLLECLVKVVAVRRACVGDLTVRNEVEIGEITDSAVTLRQSQSKRLSVTMSAKISPILLVPVVQFLADKHQQVRLLTAALLVGTFSLEISEHDPYKWADVEFSSALFDKLRIYVLSESNGPADYIAVGSILITLVKRFGVGSDGVARTLHFLYSIKDKENVNAESDVYFATVALLIDHLKAISDIFSVPELGSKISHYVTSFPCTTSIPKLFSAINDLNGQKAAASDVTPVTFDDKCFFGLRDTSFDDLSREKVLLLLNSSQAFGSSKQFQDGIGADFSDDRRIPSENVGSSQSALITSFVHRTSGSFSDSPSNNLTVTRSSSAGRRKEGESLRSAASFNAGGVSIKFEDLRDAISIHTASEIRTGENCSDRTTRTRTPSIAPMHSGNIDVRKLFNNISSTIS
ncbi:hypothetical protein HDU83_007628 [Entophlyctis luteolus]|nr:hypothetical protein HDU83_007628 [Entophlyctis luteolus]